MIQDLSSVSLDTTTITYLPVEGESYPEIGERTLARLREIASLTRTITPRAELALYGRGHYSSPAYMVNGETDTHFEVYFPSASGKLTQEAREEIKRSSERLAVRAVALQPQTKFSKERILDEAIAMLQTAAAYDSLDMRGYQMRGDREASHDEPLDTLIELHNCGNRACFAGHVRLNSFFDKNFRFNPECVAPEYQVYNQAGDLQWADAATTMAHIFSVPLWFAYWLIFGRGDCIQHTTGIHRLYGKEWHMVRASDVIEILEQLKAGKTPQEFYEEAKTKYPV